MAVIINKSLVLLKLHYFFFFGGLACVMPILPVYCGQLGLSNSAVTLIYTVLPFTVIFTKPIAGNIADWLQAHKATFLISLTLTAGFYYLIYFIPEIDALTEKTLTNLNCSIKEPIVGICDIQTTYLANGSEPPLFSCDVACDFNFTFCNLVPNTSISQGLEITILSPSNSSMNHSYLNNTCKLIQTSDSTSLSNICTATSSSCNINCTCIKTNDTIESKNVYYTAEFLMFFALMILSLDGAGVAISLGDTVVSDIIAEKNADFGCQRVFGTIGWGLLSIIAGQIFQMSSVGLAKTNYSIGFHMLLGILVLDFIICTQVKVIKQPKPKKMLGSILKLYRDPSICLFTLAVFIIGMMTGALWTFLFVYITEMGQNPLLLGLISGVQCFGGELPFFLISGWIVKKIGHLFCLSMCLICYGIRFIYYSFITNQWAVLPMEITNGITFGIFFAALVSFASQKAPQGMTATMQSILQSVFEGLGIAIGNLVAGVLYSNFGGRQMFLLMGSSSLAVGVLYTLAVLVIRRFPTIPDSEEDNSEHEEKKEMKNFEISH